MATLSQAKSQRMYSWWWDSHISPKNSRWLQDNLTDMDSKVKSMIKLIEEDADSFARRAEMYYKKRPELMKLVEEFYRAYRALAERYDHATGALRQAHRTMSEAFPNQIPLVPPDDAHTNFASEADPHTPEMSTPVRAFLDSDDSDSVTSRKGLKQLNGLFGSGDTAKFAEGRVRKGLNFHEAVESEEVAKFEKEILILKESLAKLEAEKEAGLKQYQQSLESLSKLEAEVSRAQDDSRELSEQASKAEAETQALKEALSSLKAEKEASLLQYQLCFDKLSNLEEILSHAQKDAGDLDERANKAETEARTLTQDLAKMEAEKDAVLNQYKQSLEKTSDLEKQLLLAEESTRKYGERAELAEGEVETLKLAISKLTEEKESAALLYQQCLDTISTLKLKISNAHEEVQRLNGEIESGVEKLNGAEERCVVLEILNQSLHSELETLVLKMGTQSEELTEKQKELGRLWTCIQEERLRYMEAETAFQTLQRLHSQAQDELRSLASELQNRAQILRDMQTHNESLQDEIQKLKQENKSLNELNLSSTISMEGMQNDIFSLRETNGKLEEEVELRVDQRNALQQEIYCLKEELKDLNNKYHAVLKQVATVGLNPECFETSVKELQDDNLNLRNSCQRERSEKVALLEKMEIFKKLLEKNALLENSLSDLGTELEAVGGKINVLEESCQSLLQEKSTLVDEKATVMTQLQLTTENLGKLSETNTILENSLSDAHDELGVLKEKVKSLEDSCLLLVDQKSGLISEKDTLVSQIEITQQRLTDLERRCTELDEKYSALEKEKNFTLREVEELKVDLEVQKQEHVSFAQMRTTQLAGLENQVNFLQEESWDRKRELEGELDKALDSQMEIFVLQRCVHDLGEKNSSLLIECQKLLEAAKLSENMISDLEQENLEQKVEAKSLFDQCSTLRICMSQWLKSFDIVPDHGCEDKNGQDKTSLEHILNKVQVIKSSLFEAQDENQLLAIEMSVLITLIGQLRIEAANIEMEKSITDEELRVRSEQFLMAQSESRKLFEMTEKLRLKVIDGDHKEEELMTQIANLRGSLLDMEGAYKNSKEEKAQVLEEKRVLTEELLHMEEKNHTVEEENYVIFSEMLSLSFLSLIFENYVHERDTKVKVLGEDIDKLHGVNAAVEKKWRITEEKLEDLQMENLHLKETLQKSEDELQAVTFNVVLLNHEIANGKNLFHQKEMELLEAEQKLTVNEDEKSGLSKIVEDLKREYDAVQMTREDLEKQIVKLGEGNDHLSKENQCHGEAILNLEVELRHLHDQHETTKNKVESLCSEMQKRNEESDLWEIQATALYEELQTSSIAQTLFEEKVYELIEECKSLQDRNSSKDLKIELLDERNGILESQNEELKAQLAPYGPAITSLIDSISSLEKHTNLQKSINDDLKEAELANHQRVKSHPSEEQHAMVPDAISNMQDLQARIKAIENAVIEMERVAMQENLNAYNKLESAMRQMEELRSENCSLGRNVKPTSEISEAETGLLPKDIMLDHISESSSYGISRRNYVGADDQMLELWETTDQNNSIDLSVGKGKKVVSAPTKKEQFEAVKQKSEYSSSDFLAEKELDVNKLEISKRFTEPRQEGNKRKVLERLNSDVQKLTNLQITVQDLKSKVEITEKSSRGKAIIESDTMKWKLDEAEAAIQKLFDLNGKLMKNIEDNSLHSGKKSPMESEESGSVRRRRISEQARRMSEKIGRLQLEIQRIQFDLLKLDDEKESKGKIRVTETKRRVLLRDYLYGGVRKSPRRKKAPFCACIDPPTKGD